MLAHRIAAFAVVLALAWTCFVVVRVPPVTPEISTPLLKHPTETVKAVRVTPEPVIIPVADFAVPEPTALPEPVRTYAGQFTTYGYCKGNCCCGEWAKVESPEKIPGECVAADLSVLPKGTRIYIAGLGERVVMDTGGGIKGDTLDVLYPDHQSALAHGRQTLDVWILEEIT